MSWRIPVADLSISEQEAQSVARVLRAGELGMGRSTKAFERAVARWTGATWGVALASGTAALHLACMLVGLCAEDSVIAPAMTFLASAAAPRYTGADVVLCDSSSPTDLNIDPEAVEALITPRTRAVIAVHMWGYPARVGALRALCDERGIVLIEDTAQGIGARPADADGQAGTVGHLGCLSFFSKKQLSVGEGGMVLTDDPVLAERATGLREHGREPDGERWEEIGHDLSFDDPRAALGLARLASLSENIAHRRAVAEAYRERLTDVDGLSLMWPEEAMARSTHFAFGVLFDTPQLRDRVREALADHGIQTTRYPVLHELTEYAGFADPGSLPHAEAAAARHLVLPLSARMTVDEVDEVAEHVRRTLRAHAA